MPAIQYPAKCTECSSENVKALGVTTLPITNEGSTNQEHVALFSCGDCGKLMFKTSK